MQAQSGVGAQVSWADLDEAPGGQVARLTSARVIDEDGSTVDAVDVRRPVGIEMSFVVLKGGVALFPKIKISNERGEIAFNALDTSDRWREPSAPGEYTATAWIPGNLLNEGLMYVDVTVASVGTAKLISHVNSVGVLAFHVQDPGEGDSAKGLYAGQLKGTVRPLLSWDSDRRS